MKVREVMASPAADIPKGQSCQQAAAVMRDARTGVLVVTGAGDGSLGIITDRDLVVRCMAVGANPSEMLVGDCCEWHVVTVDADADLESALESMETNGVHRLPVVSDAGTLVGILSIDDIADAFRSSLDNFLAVVSRYQMKRLIDVV